MMSTIGTEICGSSSRGSERSAISPTRIAASSSSGVSGELMKVRVSVPEMPGRNLRSWRRHHVAVMEAGKNFDAVAVRFAELNDDFAAVRRVWTKSTPARR